MSTVSCLPLGVLVTHTRDMARWSDIATWRGPATYYDRGGMHLDDLRGVVVHIAEGYYEGTISYIKGNPSSRVSANFVVGDGARGQGADGDIAQLVDTADIAYCQRAGNNGHWLSVECAGFTPNTLTAAQVRSVARILAKAHILHGVPLVVTSSPKGRGLGHHSMGATSNPDTTWGHPDCPGPAIIAQKGAIVRIAKQIVEGTMPLTEAELDQVAATVWTTPVTMGAQTYTNTRSPAPADDQESTIQVSSVNANAGTVIAATLAHAVAGERAAHLALSTARGTIAEVNTLGERLTGLGTQIQDLTSQIINLTAAVDRLGTTGVTDEQLQAAARYAMTLIGDAAE